MSRQLPSNMWIDDGDALDLVQLAEEGHGLPGLWGDPLNDIDSHDEDVLFGNGILP